MKLISLVLASLNAAVVKRQAENDLPPLVCWELKFWQVLMRFFRQLRTPYSIFWPHQCLIFSFKVHLHRPISFPPLRLKFLIFLHRQIHPSWSSQPVKICSQCHLLPNLTYLQLALKSCPSSNQPPILFNRQFRHLYSRPPHYPRLSLLRERRHSYYPRLISLRQRWRHLHSYFKQVQIQMYPTWRRFRLSCFKIQPKR